MNDQEFNKQYKTGQVVIYTDDIGKEHRTKTKSPAWLLCGTPVVEIEGKRGGYSLSRMKIIIDVVHEEGDECPELKCDGVLEYGEVEGCSCHTNPPCHACVSNPLVCTECNWVQDDE